MLVKQTRVMNSYAVVFKTKMKIFCLQFIAVALGYMYMILCYR